jgi:hypothetical protein
MLQCRTFTYCAGLDSETSKLLDHPKTKAYEGKFCRFAVTKRVLKQSVLSQQLNLNRARIFKCLRSPGINSKESIPPAYVAWRAGISNKGIVPARQAGNRFLGLLKKFANSGSGNITADIGMYCTGRCVLIGKNINRFMAPI